MLKVTAVLWGREREREEFGAKGIPIGNLTSQLFANIYMNEFDQFIKHDLKVKYYLRYTDDFAIVSKSREYLENLLPRIAEFLKERLALQLHPQKIILRPSHQGIDFLGYVILPHHRALRTKTKRRILRKLRQRAEEYKKGITDRKTFEQSLQSYLGVLSHADSYALSQNLLNNFWFLG